MVKGYWERAHNKNCETIYLIDKEKDLFYTLEITAHKRDHGQHNGGTDFDPDDGLGILKAFAEALQMGGYIPKAANDAELKATKYHLEDMRKITLNL